MPGEGETVAVVGGCFTRVGAETCEPAAAVEVEVAVAADRSSEVFAFEPAIAGIGTACC